ncbi:toll/interleukin-1 receptor domain-containing protein, partial [Flavobacterium sp. PL002]|uniref:toll/interleukin-1 receptor domain-containing protein n=1 Tax=Flavobacterium sp. PL002 TaxID=1897058 RepID=UPI0017879CC9
KIIIEPIAVKLADIFGKEKVFYDSWSMQPGDGLIDKMNEGLEKCTHFFYFVSKNSIGSNMVKMEWQNAVYKASKGNCKVIPIRLDATSMPPILSQSLYIDLYSNGLDATVGQMVNVIQGNSNFNASTNSFSNLSFKIESQTETDITFKIYASHYLEPISNFLILVKNAEGELNFSLPTEGMFNGGFNKDVKLSNGNIVNAELMKASRGITPTMPMTILITKDKKIELKFVGILHQTSESDYTPIPQRT